MKSRDLIVDDDGGLIIMEGMGGRVIPLIGG